MDELTILTYDLEQVDIIDDYFSLIWAERYNVEGDCVIELPISYMNNPNLIPGYFIVKKDTKRFMILTDIHPVLDEETGSKLVVKGLSGESMLRWRTTLGTVYVEDGAVQKLILSLLDDNMIVPDNPNRIVPNFDYIPSTHTDILSITITDQFDVSSLYDIVTKLCRSTGLGFKVEYDSETNGFVFGLYSGVDRSYDQNDVPYVIFARDYDNVLSSSYYISVSEFINVSVVTTSDEVEALQVVPIFIGDPINEPAGMQRREGVITASDIRRQIVGAPDLTDSEMLGIITQRGIDHIVESIPMGLFDGELDINSSFKFNDDFYMGDILQCNLNGLMTNARFTELVISTTVSGKTSYGSFNFDV